MPVIRKEIGNHQFVVERANKNAFPKVGEANTLYIDKGSGIVYRFESSNYVAFNRNFIHEQDEVSNSWEIQHNLNKFPSVVIIDSGNNVVFGDINYRNINEITITFSAGFSGKAYLN